MYKLTQNKMAPILGLCKLQSCMHRAI